jgi:hypothetical protein
MVMDVENDVDSIIQKVNSGEFDHLSSKLDGEDFGIFYPAYVDNGTIKMMPSGYTQTETDLKIAISSTGWRDPSAKTIAWMGGEGNAWSACKHPGSGPLTCKHHNGHGDCIHCKGHAALGHVQWTPERLDYVTAINQLQDKYEIINELAPQNLGLTLLHAHSNEHEFTKLPQDVISVVADGVTSFRKIQDVAKDETFVPNAWRFANGKLEIAGGFSQKSDE